jgi:hypothetical protein
MGFEVFNNSRRVDLVHRIDRSVKFFKKNKVNIIKAY